MRNPQIPPLIYTLECYIIVVIALSWNKGFAVPPYSDQIIVHIPIGASSQREGYLFTAHGNQMRDLTVGHIE